MTGDRVFDGMSGRFAEKIYGSRKGQIRLEILRRHLWEVLPMATPGLRLLDLGAGSGQMAALLARAGHTLVLAEPSAEMRAAASETFAAAGLALDPAAIHPWRIDEAPLAAHAYDGVLVHAVLEWVKDPKQQLLAACRHVAPGKFLSLAFYNLDGLVWRQLMRGNFKAIRKQDFSGDGRGLTPLNPLRLSDVERWLAEAGLTVKDRCGVRVFSDFMDRRPAENHPLCDLIDMEWDMARQTPYWPLARYLHLVARRES